MISSTESFILLSTHQRIVSTKVAQMWFKRKSCGSLSDLSVDKSSPCDFTSAFSSSLKYERKSSLFSDDSRSRIWLSFFSIWPARCRNTSFGASQVKICLCSHSPCSSSKMWQKSSLQSGAMLIVEGPNVNDPPSW